MKREGEMMSHDGLLDNCLVVQQLQSGMEGRMGMNNGSEVYPSKFTVYCYVAMLEPFSS